MSSRNKVYIKLFRKQGNNIFVENITNSTLTFLVILVLDLWISPQQITEKALVGYVSWPLDHFNIAVVCQLLTEPSVHTQNLIVN